MEHSIYLREQAERCRRLAGTTTDPIVKISLRRMGDEYVTRADEIEDLEIAISIETDQPPRLYG
jgi:hypothetical protein